MLVGIVSPAYYLQTRFFAFCCFACSFAYYTSKSCSNISCDSFCDDFMIVIICVRLESHSQGHVSRLFYNIFRAIRFTAPPNESIAIRCFTMEGKDTRTSSWRCFQMESVARYCFTRVTARYLNRNPKRTTNKTINHDWPKYEHTKCVVLLLRREKDDDDGCKQRQQHCHFRPNGNDQRQSSTDLLSTVFHSQ